MPRSSTLSRALALVLLVAACVVPGPSGPPAVPLHPVYRPLLAAVQDALDRDQLEVAERTLLQWRARTQVDGAVAARAGDPALIPVGRPDGAAVAVAATTIERYEEIVAGRRALLGLDLTVELRRIAGAQRVAVILRAVSRNRAETELRPGPSSMEVRRQSLEPRSGQETSGVEVLQLGSAVRLAVPAGGAAELTLTELPILVPSGAIATRTRVAVTLLGGAVVLDGRELPARTIAAPPVERTDLPAWVPAGAVAPEELARLAALPGATPEALAERAVRILPSQRLAALELLREPVATRTIEELAVLMPVLRWLCRVEGLGRDPYAWRKYMAEARWRDSAGDT